MRRGYTVYFDVQKHTPGCATIVKSPASTDLVGCGAAIAVFKQEACAVLKLETSFMIQSCCGTDCDSAGGKMIRGIGQMGAARSISLDGRGGILLNYPNGTTIEPIEKGPPSNLVDKKTKREAIEPAVQRLEKRSCTKNSWKGMHRTIRVPRPY